MRATKLLLLLSSTISVVVANTIAGRQEQNCALLLGAKIFCYGGAINGSIDTTLYSLDLSSFTTDSQGNNKTLDQLSAQWTPVTAFNNYVLEGRRTANSVSFNNNTLLIQGGLSYGKLANVTIAYHADSNTWETLPAYTVAAANSEQKQVYYDSAAKYKDNSVLYYGGSTEFPQNDNYDGYGNTTVTLTPVNQTTTAAYTQIGFLAVWKFDYNAKTWSQFSPQSQPPGMPSLSATRATFDPKTGFVWYTGGYSVSAAAGYNSNRQMLSHAFALIFDTNTGSWTNKTLGGTIPSNRIYESMTLLPNSNDILMFGGAATDTVVIQDFCYTLNLDTGNWTNQPLPVPISQAAYFIRYSHSAVLVDTSLFILFGSLNSTYLRNDMMIINVASVNNLAFVNTYPYAGMSTSPLIATNGTQTNGTSSNSTNTGGATASGSGGTGLSQGATIGIAVAAAVVGLAGIAAIIFCLRRRDKQRKGLLAVSSEHKQRDSTDQGSKLDEIHVDWDYIDNQYNNQNSRLDGLYQPQINTSNNPSPTLVVNSKISSPAVVPAAAVAPDAVNYAAHSHNNDGNILLTKPDLHNTVKPDHQRDSIKPDQELIKPDIGSS